MTTTHSAVPRIVVTALRAVAGKVDQHGAL